MLDCFKCLDLKKTGNFCSRRAVRDGGDQAFVQQGRKKGVYQLYGGRSPGQGMCDEDGEYPFRKMPRTSTRKPK